VNAAVSRSRGNVIVVRSSGERRSPAAFVVRALLRTMSGNSHRVRLRAELDHHELQVTELLSTILDNAYRRH
jgi:hypothetical protein